VPSSIDPQAGSLVPNTLQKASSGISGLDELTGGGLPLGRSTLVCGGPGCGKTLLATAFLVRGAMDRGEAGVFLSFDERIEDLDVNSHSLGYDLAGLRDRGQLAFDFIRIDRDEIEESGTFDLEGLFIRLDLAVRMVGARRVVLDTIDTLFAGLPNEAIVRSELRRLLGWLKERGLTTIVTAERGEKTFSRHGIEEYISDCVILLDHRVSEEVSTRRLRVVKYRGSSHGTNEYPFLIDRDGIHVLPVTSLGLDHAVSEDRVSTGVDGVDAMLGGRGYYRGSSVLVSGGPGCGKTSLAAHFANAACARGETCLYFSFEESPRQLVRNMRSIGIDLQAWIDRGLLHCHAARPTQHGLEMHLAVMHREIAGHAPGVIVVDPLSALLGGAGPGQVQIMVLRMVDYLKSIGTTALFLNLSTDPEVPQTMLNISSLMDTWLMLTSMPHDSEAVRALHIVKSRGMAHTMGAREIEITAHGVTVRTDSPCAAATARRLAPGDAGRKPA
jgi:circadian clock protein KaiC